MGSIYKGEKAGIFVDTLFLENGEGTSGPTIKSDNNNAWGLASIARTYEAVTATGVLIGPDDSGKTFSNDGAASFVELELNLTSGNMVEVGVNYNFVRIASQELRIRPLTGRIIYSSGVMADTKALSINSDGGKLSLVYDGNDNWIATTEFGTLVEEL
jgi:hypothetical protein